jgi:hypothetical protein
MKKELGKIQSVDFGLCGYQGACIGISLSFKFDDCGGVATDKSFWDANTVSVTEGSQWNEKTRDEKYAEIMRYVSKLLDDANVSSVNDLKGIPVELEFDGMVLKDWRILTEVI